MRGALAIESPDNDKRTLRELPSVVADGACNERLRLQISKRSYSKTEGQELTVIGSPALRVCAWRYGIFSSGNDFE